MLIHVHGTRVECTIVYRTRLYYTMLYYSRLVYSNIGVGLKVLLDHLGFLQVYKGNIGSFREQVF